MSALTGAAVLSILSVVLSVVLEVVPGLSAKWANWPYKRMAWLIGCIVVPLAWVGLAYLGAPVGLTSPGPFLWNGLIAALGAGFAAYFTSQVSFTVQQEKGTLALRRY